MMKSMLLAMCGLILGFSGTAFAQAEMPVIDQRQANQEKRFDQGIASGQRNERGANRLNKQQEHINRMEDHAKCDGVLTKGERARIDHTQDRALQHIVREKHDVQGKRHH